MEADTLSTILHLIVADDLSAAATADDDAEEDEKLAFELQLQEVLFPSMVAHAAALTEVLVISSEEAASDSGTASVTELGESSGAEFDCDICMETKQLAGDGFTVAGCAHVFCRSCIGQYIAAKVEENLATADIKCPDPDCAAGALRIEACLGVGTESVLERWGASACETSLAAAEKLYCPYKDCSALVLMGDDGAGGEGGEPMRDAECPHCRRIVCAQCRVPWHEGIDCDSFQKLDEAERGSDDLMLRRMAKKSNWQRCPECKIYVEKTDGCLYMKCRCGCGFCYSCASLMSPSNHYCQNCQPAANAAFR